MNKWNLLKLVKIGEFPLKMTLSTFDAKSVLASKEASSSQHPSVEVDLGVEPDVVCLGNLARITLIYFETQFCRFKTTFHIQDSILA